MRKIEIFTQKESYELALTSGQYFIGRSPDVEIQIDEKGISRKHARIDVQDSRVSITDLKSLNGTFVNNQEVQNKVLKPGDYIRIGPATILFSEIEEEEIPQVLPVSSQIVPENDISLMTASEKPQRKGIFRKVVADAGGKQEVEVRLRVLLFHVILAFLAYFFVFALILPSYRNLARESLIQRGKALTHFLASLNRESLEKGRTVLLDTRSISEEKDVLAAYILDNAGKIIEPAALNQRVDVYSQRAVDVSGFLMQEKDLNTLIFTVPIMGSQGRLGIARVDYQLESLIRLNTTSAVLVLVGGGGLLILSILLSSMSIKTILKPLESIKAEIDIIIKENSQSNLLPVKNKQINLLVDAINRLINRSKSSMGLSGSDLQDTQRNLSSIASTSLEALFANLATGILVLNNEFKVEYVNTKAIRLAELSGDKRRAGVHLLEILPSGPRLSKIMTAVKKVATENLDSYQWSETLADIEFGVPCQFHLLAVKNEVDTINNWIIFIHEREKS